MYSTYIYVPSIGCVTPANVARIAYPLNLLQL